MQSQSADLPARLLVTGPAGSGKTYGALARIREAATRPGERGRGAAPPEDALLILPTYAQVLHVKRLALSRWDARGILDEPFMTFTSAGERFLCRLIDEAFDEFGLYMVHHNRWVTSASTNVMGEMSAREMFGWLPAPLRRRVGRNLARRQSQRCPYLFSIAPQDFDAGVDSDITPPALAGFPPTHELLDQAWRRYLAAMEQQLSEHAFLLGERFTLADASAYGQLSMNLVDGRAEQLLQELAPRTHRWLHAIRDGEHRGSRGELQIASSLSALIDCICDTFIPLMQQNAAAWEPYNENGQSRFNEAAFDRGEALYDGELLGKPFRSVAKSFQVVVWQELVTNWNTLASAEQSELVDRYPALQRLAPGSPPPCLPISLL